jgi:catechol 2,3-dioxygenase-like lactoylglutathione lyase family enzyme
MLKLEDVTHWSIPVNDLLEAEKFYRDVLGMAPLGRIHHGTMSCFAVGHNSIILCQREEPIFRTVEQDNNLHHAFTVSAETFDQACRLFYEIGVAVEPIEHLEKGFFPGRHLYFLDPSGNRLELTDPNWKAGMPRASFEEIAQT